MRLIVDPGTERVNLSSKHSIYVETTSSDLKAWTYNQPMQIEFWEKRPSGGKDIELTIDVAMDIGTDGPGAYSFTDGVDYLEMHASPSASKVNKTTTLTSPAGTMMYVTFDDVLAEGDTVAVLNGESNSTDTLLKVTKATNNDVVYVSSNKATICVNTNDNGLDDILRAYARVLTKNSTLPTAGVDFYKNEATGYTVAKISDAQEDAISISNPIEVDAVVYDRVFTARTPATIVLPFQLPEGATTNGKFYYLKEVVKIDNNCKWKAIFRNIKLKEPNPNALPDANTPYAVIVEDGSELTFNLNGGKAEFQTATIAEQEDDSHKWIFKGTYEYKTWNSNDEEIGLAYALASENSANYTAGQYVKVGAGAYAYPMRAYVRKVNADVRLSRPLAKGEVSSIEDMPEVIDVEFVDEGEKPMAIGRMNTVTGAIKINRWIDLKGRSTNHKPTTKGVFFNKKGIAK
ncbi:hypothetical protein [Fibrobacter sp. UWB10]|uniref:hypothetical protein n=1 Tax=Fibrobacter sp. UWB10 TaxID=1896201 RepID=UPI0024B855FE|nr:hypothetical protein [Fibrobacter sp. UWB10]